MRDAAAATRLPTHARWDSAAAAYRRANAAASPAPSAPLRRRRRKTRSGGGGIGGALRQRTPSPTHYLATPRVPLPPRPATAEPSWSCSPEGVTGRACEATPHDSRATAAAAAASHTPQPPDAAVPLDAPHVESLVKGLLTEEVFAHQFAAAGRERRGACLRELLRQFGRAKGFISTAQADADFDDIRSYVVAEASAHAGCEGAGLHVYEEEFNTVCDPSSPGVLVSARDGLIKAVVHERRCVSAGTGENPLFPASRELLSVPIVTQGSSRVVGMLTAVNKKVPPVGAGTALHGVPESRQRGFSARDRDTLDTIAQQVAPGLAAWLLRRRSTRLQAHVDGLMAAAACAGKADVPALLATAMTMLDAECCQCYLLTPDGSGLEVIADGRAAAYQAPTKGGVVGHVLATGETVNLASAYDDDRFNTEMDRLTGSRTTSLLCTPITPRPFSLAETRTAEPKRRPRRPTQLECTAVLVGDAAASAPGSPSARSRGASDAASSFGGEPPTSPLPPASPPADMAGVLEVCNKRGGVPFTPQDARLLSALARQMCFALQGERRLAETSGRLSAAHRALYECGVVHIVTDAQGVATEVYGDETVLGVASANIVGKPAAVWFGASANTEVAAVLRGCARTRRTVHYPAYCYRRPDGATAVLDFKAAFVGGDGSKRDAAALVTSFARVDTAAQRIRSLATNAPPASVYELHEAARAEEPKAERMTVSIVSVCLPSADAAAGRDPLAVLNAALPVVRRCVTAHGGVLHHWEGGRIDAVFGPPLPKVTDAEAATACAFDVSEAVAGAYVAVHSAAAHIGFAGTRLVCVGRVQSDAALAAAVARRMRAKVLVTEPVREMSQKHFVTRELDPLYFGLSEGVEEVEEGVRSWQVLVPAVLRTSRHEKMRDSLAAGLTSYRARSWNSAVVLLRAMTQTFPDPVAAAYMESAEGFTSGRVEAPPQGWVGGLDARTLLPHAVPQL